MVGLALEIRAVDNRQREASFPLGGSTLLHSPRSEGHCGEVQLLVLRNAYLHRGVFFFFFPISLILVRRLLLQSITVH